PAGQVIQLGNGTAVKVAGGTRIRVARRAGPGAVDTLRVLGSATMRLVRDSAAVASPSVTVKTLATVAVSDSLVVKAATDTTPVAVYVPLEPVALRPTRAPSQRQIDSILVGVHAPSGKPQVTVIPGRPIVDMDS